MRRYSKSRESKDLIIPTTPHPRLRRPQQYIVIKKKAPKGPVLSRFFSPTNLFNVITNNDFAGLEKAIFFLGIEIHKWKVWRQLNSMQYAAKIGHISLAGKLYDDLEHYPRSFSKPKREVLLVQLMPHYETHPEFVTRVLKRVFNEIIGPRSVVYNSMDLTYLTERMVQLEAYTMLQLVIDLYHRLTVDDRPFPILIAQCCLENLKIGFFSPEFWLENTGFDPYPTPLKIAFMRADEDEIQKLASCKFNDWDWTGITEQALATGDEKMRKLVFKHVKFTARDVVERIHSLPLLGRDLPDVISFFLAHENFDSKKFDWLVLYVSFLLNGEVKMAREVKPLVDFSNWSAMNRIFRKIEDRAWEDSLSSDCDRPKGSIYLADIPVEDFREITNALGSLVSKPGYKLIWTEMITEFPFQKNRPDLDPNVLNFDQVEDRISTYYNTTQIIREDLHVQFLGASDKVTLGMDLIGQGKENWLLLEKCAMESGKRVILNTSTQRSCTGDDIHQLENQIQDLENKRKASLTLQKLCRLQIRRCIIDIRDESCQLKGSKYQSDPPSVSDDILSLFVDGHLPKEMVNYVLYRRAGCLYYLLRY